MLAARYRNDGRPVIPLTPRQQEALALHRRKLAEGAYPAESRPCPVCDRAGGEPLAEKDRYGIPLGVVICPDCGLIRTEPRMTQAAYADYYNAEYRALYNGREHPDEAYFRSRLSHGRTIHDFVRTHGVRLDASSLVVDVGCGAGGILKAFQETGCRTIGCDLGDAFLDYGRRVGGLDLRHGFLKDLVAEGPADLVIYSHVFEHILDVRAEIATIRSMLKPGGFVHIEVPSVKNLWKPYQGDFLRLLQNAHTYHFSLATVTNLFAREGFRLVAGDEAARALFTPGPGAAPKNDYPAVMRHLRRAEFTRRLHSFRKRRFREGLARLLGA